MDSSGLGYEHVVDSCEQDNETSDFHRRHWNFLNTCENMGLL
jgi:hypothetical protein